MDSATPTQNRRVMSASSGLGPVSAVTVTGSSAIPQIGHEPGPGRRISGCIGQVHSATSPGVAPWRQPAGSPLVVGLVVMLVIVWRAGVGAQVGRRGWPRNLAWQCPEQKKKICPSCSTRC